MVFELSITQAFIDQLYSLPAGQVRLINRKLDVLRDNPLPDGKQRKQLKHQRDRIYRLRVGNYRVLYHFNSTLVRLLGVDARSDVYEGIDDLVVEPLPRIDPLEAAEVDAADLDAEIAETGAAPSPWLATDTTPGVSKDDGGGPTTEPGPALMTPLTHPITADLLAALKVPEAEWTKLEGIATLDDLMLAEIDDRLRDRLFHVTSEPDIDQLLQAPVFELSSSQDLEKLADGDIIELLLRLDETQERLVALAVNAGGPVMVKGGPGSGKTTIAVRRVAKIIESLRADGIEQPRILFTTYTNALVSTTRQLLARALGDDAGLVEVVTTDSLMMRVYRAGGNTPNMTGGQDVPRLMPKARKAAGHPPGEGPIAKISDAYLENEIMSVIVAREIPDLAAYQGIERSGRRVALRRAQREAVWAVWEALDKELAAQKKITWPMMRRRAVELVRAGGGARPADYDAILVDEVQDLDPTAIRLLTELCPARSRLFLTADANQSIYGGTFNWRAVHADLRFQGRSGNLTRSHRTTYEIVRLASRYLATDPDAPLDEIAARTVDDGTAERIADQFPRRGPEPVIETIAKAEDAPDALARFIRAQTVAQKVGPGGVAILVPTMSYGETLRRELEKLDIRAEAVRKDEIDLSSPTVKITTLQSSKGLEFPVVAIAGLHVEIPPGIQGRSPEEQTEEWQRRRRILYVGMTRAMRSLLVLVPAEPSPLTAGLVATEVRELATV
ncbi:MAG TPA: UvrD-helicase domain-containing protein [Thermomicrobiales bacterium]|jgi:superfamily I DNA/RNA helicase/mRNA-degrading endonuclease RelE of RelBE toxin-antitoxin system|nr:UvrD-helicase domain-containing protein [Thermomicrobiales bacterium]